MLVTIPPGGAPDISARLVAQGLQEAHGWTVVDREPDRRQRQHRHDRGRQGHPDGYTLALLADSSVTINPHVYSKLGIDTLKDLLPVAQHRHQPVHCSR